MLLVLPPSETKRDGGDATPLDLAALSFPELTPQRRAALAALRTLSRSVSGSMQALALGPTQRFEIDRNRALATAPVMPALERYTGVLYDGLEVESLSTAERQFAAEHVVIHSALFGLVRAGDRIPAYRLSHDSRLPGLSLRRHWREAVTATLAAEPGLVLDLRSESYAHLGPAPEGATYIRVVSEDAKGRRVALSHFNKKGKGEFTRAVIAAGTDHATVESLVAWAAGAGIRLEAGAPGELDLVVG
ncbi:MAG: peroxide stress protein YaaA [Actinobacteria bacterium]|nr:peroxide stress protein YaaA [Actinomycetota bacterium]